MCLRHGGGEGSPFFLLYFSSCTSPSTEKEKGAIAVVKKAKFNKSNSHPLHQDDASAPHHSRYFPSVLPPPPGRCSMRLAHYIHRRTKPTHLLCRLQRASPAVVGCAVPLHQKGGWGGRRSKVQGASEQERITCCKLVVYQAPPTYHGTHTRTPHTHLAYDAACCVCVIATAINTAASPSQSAAPGQRVYVGGGGVQLCAVVHAQGSERRKRPAEPACTAIASRKQRCDQHKNKKTKHKTNTHAHTRNTPKTKTKVITK